MNFWLSKIKSGIISGLCILFILILGMSYNAKNSFASGGFKIRYGTVASKGYIKNERNKLIIVEYDDKGEIINEFNNNGTNEDNNTLNYYDKAQVMSAGDYQYYYNGYIRTSQVVNIKHILGIYSS